MGKRIKLCFRDVFHLLTSGLLIIAAVSCRQAPAGQWTPDPQADLNVYFFHINDRCPACTAVGENTEWVLNNYFSNKLEDGSLKYESFNIDTKENKAVAAKYQISYTSLLIIRSDGTLTDFTNNAMNYANTSPDKFMEMLKTEIGKNLE